jgi:2-oxoglutarate dehydrogenase complex dehydrogenase (E1) component-like enzyme
VNTELVLQIASAPGIQLKVVSRLKQLGLICTKRTLKETPFEDTRYLVLELEGPELPHQQIVDQLRAVHGIISFDKLVQESNEEPPQTEQKQTVEQEEHHHDIAPEAGDADIRDRMLVFSLLSRYPKVGARLYEIMSTIPEEERLNRAQQLGHGFGTHLFKQQKLSSPVTDLPDALSRLIMPAISPMAELHVQDNVLAVTGSKINIKPKKPQEESCQFLLGTLNGLLNAAQLGEHQIKKLCCAMEGAESCKYQFVSA